MAGSITPYQTAQGKRWRVRYRKPDKSQTDKRGFKTKREAELFLASVTISKARGEYADPTEGRRTLGAFCDQWKAERLATLKPSSRHAMETAWRVHVEPKWSDRAVAGITESEVATWVANLIESGKSAQTVRRIVFVLSGVLTIAVRERARSNNPAAGVTLPKKQRKPARYLTHQQVALLADSSESSSLLVEFLAYTGLRWGEAVALRVRHLNMLRHRITVEDNAVIVKGVYRIGSPKSGHARIVPMPPHLVALIGRQCEGKGPDSFLFGEGAVPLPHTHATSGWFARAVRAAQRADPTFPRITPHDLRHTAASLAVSSGANVKAIQRMLGHSSAAMTLDVYAELFDDDLEAVATAMSAARAAAVS